MSEKMMTITVKDLRCTATREQADNVLRKSWVLQMPEDKVKFLEKLPQETRFEFYESMDHDVRQLHIQKMRQYKG
ncbi:RNA polymerase binding protein [Serratia phage PS2]|uniref:RNA polymerase binding protein n=1 Tax=Serratia phage PS2 TaxID=1481112 RepID=A0A023W661_9CAUD|nr:RNA polymerase binding [Serratia phage PS2]AHY25306.1 RNA polymerase binding protein [Serratia phage PS2]